MPTNADIKEIKQDIKEIKQMITDQLITVTKLDQEVALHRKLWAGLVGIVISIGVFFIQKQSK